MKISSFDLDLDGKKIIDNYSAIIKNNDILPKQAICLLKKDDKYIMRNFNRYVKLYEVFDSVAPLAESVIPRRIV